jgi:hypothetical protein
MGLLVGMGTHLAPEFDPWAETLPFAEQLAADELRGGWRAALRGTLAQAERLWALPRRIDSVLGRALRGQLQVAPNAETKRLQERLERSLRRLGWTVAASGAAIAGALLRAPHRDDPLGLALLALAGALFLLALFTR